ncbi:DUF4180 domain-containing protein [Paenibacillus athensensis]|uniref:PadR family transcriptional regulator n=1 Tax=Paenibacillus athensensis TaxID=1967502 RepID=A0A4Y8Q5Y5_9BACL|nr:DUF4180 domain-containing protein [Paenibacillus athensensis]MCD1258388.1 DUF4180 domain-containing protein [Paenibacillus athensensis]
MSIHFALLGLLSCRPLTGYDLKKIIQESPFMYWSGNNNQIYKALVELLDEGQVTCEVQQQESAPPKKVYTITSSGLSELKKGVLAPPEPPEMKKTFLLQLAWSDLLDAAEWEGLLSAYEQEVRMRLLLGQEQRRRGSAFAPGRTPREQRLWSMIDDNIEAFYRHELQWVQQLREEFGSSDNKEDKKMNVEHKQYQGAAYIVYTPEAAPLATEQDVLDLIAVCMETDVWRVLLPAEALADDFFKLRTGLAGYMLQKFANYRVRGALVITDESKLKGKMKELVAELNRGGEFRVFNDRGEAEVWLVG